MVLICSTIIICFFGYLYYKAGLVYTDEPVDEGPIVSLDNHITGMWVRYKRTYKNGKVTFFEKKY